MNTTVNLWALAWLVVVAVLVLLSGRLGGPRTATWLTAIGVFLLAIEEPALTLWLATAEPGDDRDGMVTLITPMARAHVLDTAVVSLAAAVALEYLAFTGLRNGRGSAWRALVFGFGVALVMEVTTTGLVFSRGLPLPGAAGEVGRHAFGWTPVAVGLVAWAAGLLIGRPARAPAQSTPSPDVPVEATIRRYDDGQ